MTNFALLQATPSVWGGEVFVPQEDPFTVKWGLALGLGEGVIWGWLCGSLPLNIGMHVCPCMESCVCKGLEVLFLGRILCGHVVMLLPMNKHMAGGSREGKLRGEGLHGAS